MTMRTFIAITFGLLQLLAYNSSAATYDVVVNQEVNVSSRYLMLPKSQKAISIHQVFNLPNDAWLQQTQPLQVTDGQNWLAIDIMNRSEGEGHFYLAITNNLQLKNIVVYELGYGNSIKITDIERHYNSLSSARLNIPAKSTKRVFLAISSDGNSTLSLNVSAPSKFIHTLSYSQYATGIAIGGMLALALVMLMLFTANGSRSLLVLCGYFFMQTLLLSVLLGINLYRFFPDIHELRGFEIPLLTSFSAILLLWFARELFELKKQGLWLNRVLRLFGWLLLLYLPISMLLPLNANLLLCKLIDVSATGVLIATGVYLIKQKQQLARLFTIVMLLHILFTFSNIISDTWYGFNTTLYTLAFWLHGFLITFILSRQYYYQNLEREQAQTESAESNLRSHHAQEELLALQKANQEQLELRVQERTLELNIALQELENANQELAEKNTLDDLTGLFNRRHYDQKIVAEFRRSRRNLTPLSIVVIDIDYFKKVNDTYGHVSGDTCLITLANIIKSNLQRSTDIGCRYGGEEFCLILPETDSEGAVSFAEVLRIAVEQTAFNVENTSINLSISCGVSTYQQQSSINATDLFIAADKALYQAKHQGRNQVVTFDLNTLDNEQE